jgi:hypothetical protein
MFVKMSRKYKRFLKKLTKIRKKKADIEEIERKFQEKVQAIDRDIVKAEQWVKEPKHIIVLKVIVVLLAFGLVGYIFAVNFLISQDFDYFYDIGGGKDVKNPYLYPSQRISPSFLENQRDYRNLTGHLIYFDVPVPRGAETISFNILTKDPFPKNERFFLGIRKDSEGKYDYKEIFPNFEEEAIFSLEGMISVIDFDLTSAYIAEGKLNTAFHLSYLEPGKTQTNMSYIQIDWINIAVHKPGLFERYEIKSWKDIPNLWKSPDPELVVEVEE